MTKRGLLERLRAGEVVLGDGGFTFCMERRGYVKQGPLTPEVVVEHPEAVRQLHREFLRAGADVMQAFTFYASDDKLENRGNQAQAQFGGKQINNAACDLAREVAREGDALFAAGVCQTPSYLSGKSKAAVQQEFRKQFNVFVQNNVDFIICEYFEHVEEIEWAIEAAKETGLPVASTMCIGPEGELHGVSAGQCAVRMAKAGADLLGVNCHFGPPQALQTLKLMRAGLEEAGLWGGQGTAPFLMLQPIAYFTPDAKIQGFIDLPEFPFALEPRLSTRFEIQMFAREAYEAGIRYIGGCCGFEPCHIRALAEELSPERGGRLPKASEKHGPWGEGLSSHTKPWVRARASEAYWRALAPASGRPYCPSMSRPDEWGVTAGHDDLIQHENGPASK